MDYTAMKMRDAVSCLQEREKVTLRACAGRGIDWCRRAYIGLTTFFFGCLDSTANPGQPLCKQQLTLPSVIISYHLIQI